ncbi:MAG: DUF6165 family protein [Gammaproteobacteria bacterium]|nr:DUF6165 family protein [Gammaproteobacteria bacterium]MDE0301630.1 DUF6165 family protein [Gammaproteobacteria bacterium]
MEQISVPVSPGELVDKITILEIKAERITDEEKLQNVKTELELLVQVWEAVSLDTEAILPLKETLKGINQALWDIEDQIRIKESRQEFDQEFINLARSVYVQNDQRAAAKKQINAMLGSSIMEEKSYAEY